MLIADPSCALGRVHCYDNKTLPALWLINGRGGGGHKVGGCAAEQRDEVPPPYGSHGDFLRPNTRPAEPRPLGEVLGWNVYPE